MFLAAHNEGPQPCLFLRPPKQAPHRARLPELGRPWFLLLHGWQWFFCSWAVAVVAAAVAVVAVVAAVAAVAAVAVVAAVAAVVAVVAVAVVAVLGL